MLLVIRQIFLWSIFLQLVGSCAGGLRFSSAPFQLAIFHINDHHSHLGPNPKKSLVVNEKELNVEVGGMERVAAFFRQNASKYPHTLKLHAGDALSGDLYYVLYKGKADAALMSDLCLDAFTIGNHEFDDTDENLAQFLRLLQQGPCPPAVLSANTRPQLGTFLAPSRQWELLQPYVVKEWGKEKVGIIGITVAAKTKLSSRPLASTQFLPEVATAQEYIRELKAQGIAKIILLTHQGYDSDLALASQLTDVDIIVGGHTHSLLGDFTSVGLESDGPYPTSAKNADGDVVCVVQAYAYAEVVGELVANFVGDKIASCQGRPHLLVGEDFPVGNSPVLTGIAPDPATSKRLASFQQHLDSLSKKKIATIPERICRQNPLKGREANCGASVQSDVHQVVAQAFLAALPVADLALQNGGGVRSDLPAGEFTVGLAYRLLPFSNTLYLFHLSGGQIKQVLEDAVGYALSAGGGGSYPYGAGIKFAVNIKMAKNQRVSKIQVRSKSNPGQWVDLVDDKSYQVVANSFIASGKDGWFTLGQALAAGQGQNTYLNYTQTFIDYARQQKQLVRPAANSHSTIQ